MNTTPMHPRENFASEDYEECRLFRIYPDSLGSFMWQAGVNINLGEWTEGNEDLEARFSAWADEFPDHPKDPDPDPTAPEWQDWDRRGFELSKEVRAIVPEEYMIIYHGLTGEPRVVPYS